jgi:protease-4
MKTVHIIIIAVAVVVVMAVIFIAFGMRGISYGGDIGVVEIEEVITTAKHIVNDLKNYTDDPSIQAIIIRVNSPGGGVAASQEIYEQVKKSKKEKKIVVSMGAVAASGGYYVSLPADVIVANPGTITGSIGVIMEFAVIEELLDKIGVYFEVIKSREHKDIGSPFRKMSERERQLLHDVVIDVYQQFVEATSEERAIPIDSVLKIADGRILTGRQAVAYGLVDTLGGFEDAVKIAGDLVGIEKPNLVYPIKRMSLIDYFTEPVERLLFMPRLSYLWR